MTHSLAAPAAVLPTKLLLACGTVAGPLFLTVGLVQGLTRDGFDFGRNALSQLSLGDLGLIQQAAFLLTGALLLAGAAGLRRHRRPGGLIIVRA
ncbi:DUF998 domain-containing protein [Kitasatospora sp. NPDC091207]|uniref:DUF998 domain-containing protein n=1 Tax=Kitasatospora sp. NPDC091207 TaxID=3364083 RepID=UPI0037FC6099